MTYPRRWVVTGRADALIHAHTIYFVATAHCLYVRHSRYQRRQRFFLRRLGKIVLYHGAILRFLKQSFTVYLSLARQPFKSLNVPKKTFHDIFHPTTALSKNQQPAPHRSWDRENFSSTTFQAFTACDFSIDPLDIYLVHTKTTTGECFPYAAIKQQ